MLSKKMYEVLSCFPRNFTESIKFEVLQKHCKLPPNEIMECLVETTLSPRWNYVRSSKGFIKGSDLFLTESGLAEVEDYEQAQKSHRLVIASFIIAVVAMLAAIASAVAAFLTLV